LLNNTEKLNESYKDFAIDMVEEVKKVRDEKLEKLKGVEEELLILQ
jgi:hypothetical protein